MGAVPTYEKSKQGARDFIRQSTHKDAKSYLTDTDSEASDDEGPFLPVPGFDEFDCFNGDAEPESGDNVTLDDVSRPAFPDTGAQCLHTILHTILGFYKRMQQTGGI